ncbi:MAG: alanine/glycine:cation symporter family protein [Pirellulaceae bacterium]|nr:alanine/glycine:cation symporter family protein [Pirellulaceae bacterium]MDG2104452.1 alanine/glycine:cation symporter family protein [Pirellulaceae bacterium]
MASRTRGTTRFRALILLLLAALIGITAVNAAAGHPYPPVQEEANAEAPAAAAAAEPAEVLGWDKQIDQKFKPVAEWFGSVVLYKVQLFGSGIPIVVIVLVIGATFFTLFFGLINIRLFPLAIGIVSGRHDAVDEDDDAEAIAESKKSKAGDHHGEVTHFQALATAVSGTVGLGNIAGVAIAISVGGPGATFWMIVCGLLGMSTKFVECTLGVKYRDIDESGVVHGGPMYYLSKGLKGMGLGPLGGLLAIVFAMLCVGGSLGGGNAFQANQATEQITSLLNLQSGSAGTIIGLVMAALVGIVIIGGIKRIASITEKIVPLMAIIYIVASLIIIGMNIGNVPNAIGQIFSGAFTPAAGFGGLIGVLIVGFQRAAFSNEAGAGSAAIAHSAVRTKYPASEGLVALLEPFIDTVVICTMTAIVIILFNIPEAGQQPMFPYGDVESNQVLINGERIGGVELTSEAYDSVLPGFRYVLTIAIILFAFSTMISWSYYGLQSWKFLFGRSPFADISYKLLFLAFIVIGSAASLGSVLDFSDAMILAMVFPNMLGLLLLFPTVRHELKRYLEAIKNHKN